MRRGVISMRAAVGVAAAACALVWAGAASAATNQLNADCTVAPGGAAFSNTAPVAFESPHLAGSADAGAQALTARALAEKPATATGDACGVRVAYVGQLIVDAGTSGLAPGTPVTLRLTAGLEGGMAATHGGEAFLATSDLTAGLTLVDHGRTTCDGRSCTPEVLARLDATASREVRGTGPSALDADGSLTDGLSWSWRLSGRPGSEAADAGGAEETLCESWPCGVQPPVAGFPMGERTVELDTTVGARLELTHTLSVLSQAYDGAGASASTDVTTPPFTVSFAPGPGAEGIALIDEPGTLPPDTTPPELTVPDAVQAEADQPAGAGVNFAASAEDDRGGPVQVSCAPPAGSVFPIGTTTVTCEAFDTAGNRAEAAFPVTVADTTGPVLTLPAAITAEATDAAGALVTWTATADDLVDGPVPVACEPASGALFPLGVTPVACAAEDTRGNRSTGGFTVTVVESLADRTAPAIEVSAPIRDGVYAVRQDVPAVYACTDEPGGSGVATCVGSIALGEPLDTATAGAKELVVTATDNAGNSRTVRVPYSVEHLAVPLEVSVRCVELLPDNRLQALYNVVNRNPFRLRIPVGSDNEFLPEPTEPGPVLFERGSYVLRGPAFRGGALVWRIDGSTVVATNARFVWRGRC